MSWFSCFSNSSEPHAEMPMDKRPMRSNTYNEDQVVREMGSMGVDEYYEARKKDRDASKSAGRSRTNMFASNSTTNSGTPGNISRANNATNIKPYNPNNSMNVRKIQSEKKNPGYRKDDDSFDHDADEFDERIPSANSKSLERQPQTTFVN